MSSQPANWRRPMVARDRTESHRVATSLELLFDLCFVVAVAALSDRLHHAVLTGHVADGVLNYAMVFFAIWWAWMNFTWFASAYDRDDVPYRLATFVQIAGVLILAAGVPRAFDTKDFTLIYVGYVVMRLGLVSHWLRASRADRGGQHRTALRYAIGITVCMVGWAGLLVTPVAWRPAVFAVMVVAELSVPVWAERTGATPWHPHHIAERYGLFTLIVLGETILSATGAIKAALDVGGGMGTLAWLAGSGLVIVFSLWWVYFGQHAEEFLRSNRDSFRWGYGHYFILAAAAAVGAGLGVAVDYRTEQVDAHEASVGAITAAAAVAIPVAVFLLFVWLLHVRPHRPGPLVGVAYPVAVVLVLATMATPVAVALVATVTAALVLVTVIAENRRSSTVDG